MKNKARIPKDQDKWVAEQSRSRFGTWEVYTLPEHYRAVDPTVPGGSVETSRKAATLQAAAPELLEVVQLYLELSPDQPPNLSALARAAIAKAEGK